MKFKAYLIQDGEGCDYTIACGKKVIDIDATDLDSAYDKLFEIIEEEYTGDNQLKSVELYEINEIYKIDINNYNSFIRKKILDKKEKEKNDFELLELERLMKKYGK